MDRIELLKVINEHTSFTTMLYELMKSLLETLDVKYHTIECRTKTIESLEEKVGRKNIKDTQKEITDISGIRIILYYVEDIDKVVDLVKNNFTIDERNSVNKANLYNSNEFGYLSVHYIVTLDSKRNILPEWKYFSKLKAEIQIRTVLQHSWASISHELTYKKSYEIPKELERKLFRLAGLFELADEQFLKIKEEHNSLKNRMQETSTENIKKSEINLLTLKYYIFEKEYTICNTIEKIALEAGFVNAAFVGGWSGEDEDTISNLVMIADILGYKFVNEIEKNLQLKIEDIKLYFIELKKMYQYWMGYRHFYFEFAMLFLLDIEQFEEFSARGGSGWGSDSLVQMKNATIKIKNSKQ